MKEQEIGKDETAYPAVTVRKLGKGTITAIHGDFMKSYYVCHHPRHRVFMRELLNSLKYKTFPGSFSPCEYRSDNEKRT